MLRVGEIGREFLDVLGICEATQDAARHQRAMAHSNVWERHPKHLKRLTVDLNRISGTFPEMSSNSLEKR